MFLFIKCIGTAARIRTMSMECKNTSSVRMSERISLMLAKMTRAKNTERSTSNVTMHQKAACGIDTRFSFLRISSAASLAIAVRLFCNIFLSSSEKRIGKSFLSRSCRLSMVVRIRLSD